MEFSDVFKNYLKSGAANKSESSAASSKEAAIGPVAPYQTSIFQQDKNSIKYAIAPVSSRIKDRMTVDAPLAPTLLRKGLFEDGWQFGDLAKTILGTGIDTAEDLTIGAASGVEQTIDALALGAPMMEYGRFIENGGIYTLKQLEEQEKKRKESVVRQEEFVKKDILDEQEVARSLLGSAVETLTFGGKTLDDIAYEENSVLGSKADALVQSGGSMLARKAVAGYAPGADTLLLALSSMGGEAENALLSGATYEEAMGSGVASAAAEVFSEMISDGIKLDGMALPDVMTKQIGRVVTNKALRNLAAVGVDMAGEGAEEILSGVLSAIGQKLTYAEDKELRELFTKEDQLDSFVGGMIMGMFGGGVNAVKSGRAGVDYASGLNADEKKVIDQLYNEGVEEAKKKGDKVNKRKIYDDIVSGMDRGEIAIDDIERILGGESYKTYKDTVTAEDATLKQHKDLTEEYKTLNDMDIEQMSDEQLARQNELRKQIKGMQEQVDNIKTNSQRESMRTKLSEDVYGLVKGTRLMESYHEKAKRGQTFEADLTQYDEKQRTTVQKAIDSGILNNTRKTHEFVDLVAKISADKGVAFDFINNKKLKESGFSIEGKEVNGFVTKDGVSLNIDSRKALNTTVGHEITHVMEGTELYTEMQKAVFAYAESKGELGSRWSKLKELYKGIDGADVNAELTADLVGDYLFSDDGFIRNLSTGNRNVFQKIYDEIKYLCKAATAGSKEARELERIKHLFEEAYRADRAQKNTADGGALKYALSDGTTKKASDLSRKDLEQRKYLENNEVVYDKKTMNGRYQVGSGRIVAVTHDTPFIEDIIPQNTEKSIETEQKEIAPTQHSISEGNEVFKEYGSYNVYGSDIGIAPTPLKTNLSDYAVDLIRFATEGDLTWGKARQIIDRPEYREAFEEVTGITLEGSRSEQKRIVMGAAEELRRYEGAVQMEDVAPIGDVDRVRPPKPKASMTIHNDERFQPLLEVMTDGKMTFAGAKTIANSGALRHAFESLYGITLPKTNTKAVPHILSLAEDVESMADAYEATQNIAPIAPRTEFDAPIAETAAPVAEEVDIAPVNMSAKNTPKSRDIAPVYKAAEKSKDIAPIPVKQKKQGIMSKLVNRLVDKGMVFENVALDSGNMELQAKWDYALPSKAEARAQYFMRNGKNGSPSLDSVRKWVEKSGKTEAFEDYMWHWRNVDSMTLSERFGVDDKPVFGTSVTADISRKKIAQYEQDNPEFKDFAKALYSYMAEERRMMVESGLITEEQAKHMEAMYPHYIPLHRETEKMLGPVQGMDLGVNSPIKSATGGNRPLQPMFDTIAQHTIHTFKAAARNDFGVELKNTIQTSAKTDATNADEILDSIDNQGNLLGTGRDGYTFSVYENGERVTFDITEEMHDALKPTEGILAKRIKPLTTLNNVRRNLITSWNPVFALYRNPAKDIQDVMINSQHPVKTYKNVPKAAWQLLSSGEWATEYLENGGEQNTYYDNRKSEFTKEESVFKKLIGMPVRGLEAAGEFIERIPRLAEYIASREEGRSIQRSMLDAARVTTNFAAGGDFTKFLNSHGFTFLNAGVQGTSQFVRNFREAKLNGLKGWVQLAAKFTAAGLADDLLNGLFWDEEEDEDYEALSDHVKQNYYVIAKTQDGKFIRFPKGRVAAVIQDAMEEMEHLVTGDDEADFESFFKLVMDNLAPGNPLDNNIIAPINQALVNKTWYDDNLVPTRLAKLPAAEQFDESTDSISKWLGEKMDISPYKINYLIDQYSGGLGDFALPMLTSKAESDDDSLLGYAIAPWKKEFTVDSVLNNKATGDFYETLEAAEAQAESEDATPEDKLKSSFLISYNVEISKLMQEQRDIQTSDLPDSEKYKRNREIKEEINTLQKEALESLKDDHIDGIYAEVGDKRFNYSEEDDTWWEVKPQLANGEDNWYYTQEQLFHDNLGVSYADYWNGRLDPDKYEVTSLYDEVGGKRYNFDMEENAWFEIKPKKADGTDNPYYQNEQEALKAFGISSEEYWNNRDMYDDLSYVGFGYDKNDAYDDSIQTAKNVFGYKKFAEYASVLKTLKADKDSNGNSISGSKKKKVKEYVYSLDIPEIYKHILFKSQYKKDRSHNREIATYIGESTGMSYRQKLDVLNELGYKVDDKGNIRW